MSELIEFVEEAPLSEGAKGLEGELGDWDWESVRVRVLDELTLVLPTFNHLYVSYLTEAAVACLGFVLGALSEEGFRKRVFWLKGLLPDDGKASVEVSSPSTLLAGRSALVSVGGYHYVSAARSLAREGAATAFLGSFRQYEHLQILFDGKVPSV
jgi:hypothetical protein